MFNTTGSSGSLRGARPTVKYGDVVCVKCGGIPCDFDETGVHSLFAQPDAEGNHPGSVLMRAYCHGAEEDVRVTFAALRANAGKKIEVFADIQAQLPSEPLKLE